ISHRSEKVNIPQTIVADTVYLTPLLTNLVCTDPSFSYNHFYQLNMHATISLCLFSPKVSIINSLH
ncbi:unnamed protein product, partial [Hymenolepis diminuta]